MLDRRRWLKVLPFAPVAATVAAKSTPVVEPMIRKGTVVTLWPGEKVGFLSYGTIPTIR